MADKRLFLLLTLAASITVAFATPIELRVAGDRVNLRARPIADSEVVGQVSSGDTLFAPDKIATADEWIKVRPPQSIDLWLFSALVKDGEIIADNTLVRCGPGLQYKFVGKLNKGDKVSIRGTDNGDWLRIAPVADKCELYISSAYVLVVPKEQPPLKPPAVVNQKYPAVTPDSSVVAAPSAVAMTSSGDAESAKADVPKLINVDSKSTPVQAEKQLLARAVNSTPPAATPVSSVAAAIPTVIVTPSVAVEPAKTNVPETIKVDGKSAPPIQAAALLTTHTVNPQQTTRSQLKLKLPTILSKYQLDAKQPQAVEVAISGRLERIPVMRAPGFTHYQIVEKTGALKSAVICRIIGLPGQWSELVGSELAVSGFLWKLSDDSIPVLQALHVDRLASWEE